MKLPSPILRFGGHNSSLILGRCSFQALARRPVRITMTMVPIQLSTFRAPLGRTRGANHRGGAPRGEGSRGPRFLRVRRAAPGRPQGPCSALVGERTIYRTTSAIRTSAGGKFPCRSRRRGGDRLVPRRAGTAGLAAEGPLRASAVAGSERLLAFTKADAVYTAPIRSGSPGRLRLRYPAVKARRGEAEAEAETRRRRSDGPRLHRKELWAVRFTVRGTCGGGGRELAHPMPSSAASSARRPIRSCWIAASPSPPAPRGTPYRSRRSPS
jgi:hypothetical protein